MSIDDADHKKIRHYPEWSSFLFLSLFLTCFFLTITASAMAQVSNAQLSGIVKNGQTAEELPAANVFLSGTRRGTSSNKEGKFKLTSIKPGSYELVVSFVGYEPWARKIHLSPHQKRYITISLQPREYQLKDISVTGEIPRAWEKNLRHFKQIFLGEGPNADLTWFQNPEILNFETRDNQLFAEARGILEIENRALGYKLYVVLKTFRWSQLNDSGVYTFYPRFELLDPPTQEIARKWKRKRRYAFEGSLHHFLLALRRGETKQKGYYFKHSLIKRLSEGEKHMALLSYGGLSREYRQSLVGFELKGDVKINYKIYAPSFLLKRSGDTFFVDSYGNLLDPKSMTVAGRWARERVSDLVPYEFRR